MILGFWKGKSVVNEPILGWFSPKFQNQIFWYKIWFLVLSTLHIKRQLDLTSQVTKMNFSLWGNPSVKAAILDSCDAHRMLCIDLNYDPKSERSYLFHISCWLSWQSEKCIWNLKLAKKIKEDDSLQKTQLQKRWHRRGRM